MCSLWAIPNLPYTDWVIFINIHLIMSTRYDAEILSNYHQVNDPVLYWLETFIFIFTQTIVIEVLCSIFKCLDTQRQETSTPPLWESIKNILIKTMAWEGYNLFLVSFHLILDFVVFTFNIVSITIPRAYKVTNTRIRVYIL